jgi:FkbM family methyltransferase
VVKATWPFLTSLPDRRLVLVDVGAADDPPIHWRSVPSEDLQVLSFEPDGRSDVNTPGQRILVPEALGDAPRQATLHLARKPQVSSIYEPNMELLDRYPQAERWQVVDSVDVELKRLDAVLDDVGVKDVDAIKLDVQGAELDVLKGAGALLDQTLVIDIEIEFVDLYIGQPLFADVDGYLRAKGFVLIDIDSSKWRRAEVPPLWDTLGGGEITFANCVYFKSPDLVPATAEKVSRAIALALLFKAPNIAHYLCTKFADALGAAAEAVLIELERSARVPLPTRARRKLGRILSR